MHRISHIPIASDAAVAYTFDSVVDSQNIPNSGTGGATYNGAAATNTFVSIACVSGDCMQVTPASPVVTIGTTGYATAGLNWSVSVWIRYAHLDNNSALLASYGVDVPVAGVNNFIAYRQAGTTPSLISLTLLSDSYWHHVVVTSTLGPASSCTGTFVGVSSCVLCTFFFWSFCFRNFNIMKWI